jgi:hypothetical protein
MNHHRVERVLHFMSDARGQTAERRELARIPDGGLYLAEVFQVARNQHHADQFPVRVVDGVAHDEPFAHIGECRRERSLRPVSRNRLLSDAAQAVVRWDQIGQRRSDGRLR